MTFDILKAIVLGIVEGLTEFVPVSSTGHLLLVQRFFGFADEDFGKTFAVLIQFGAILALLSIYFGRLWALATHMFTDWAAARFVIGVLLAFLPAAVIGALMGSYIKLYLFDVRIVCISLIIGGFVLNTYDTQGGGGSGGDSVGAGFHYDEAMGVVGPIQQYKVVSYFEDFRKDIE